MRVLLDTCLSRLAREAVQAAGHDVVWGGDWREDPGDDAIIAIANREQRILVTIDKDFGELAVVRGAAHSGIIRLAGFSSAQQGPLCNRLLVLYADRLERGAILTVTPGRVRVREP